MDISMRIMYEPKQVFANYVSFKCTPYVKVAYERLFINMGLACICMYMYCL